MFLDDDQLLKLTGYRQAKKQIAVLKQQRIPFHVNASGHPVVASAIIEGKHVKQERQVKEWTPLWAANRL